MRIYKAIADIMRDVEPVSKSRKNVQQGYSFRGIDDVYQALQAIMAKHGVFTVSKIIGDRTEDRTTAKGSALIYRIIHIKWKFYAEDGSAVESETIGEGQDSGDKATNKAMSVAHKYALLQVFCIPTEDPKDPENDSHELKPGKQTAPSSEWQNAVRAFAALSKKPDDMVAYLREVFGAKAPAKPADVTKEHIDALHTWYEELKRGN